MLKLLKNTHVIYLFLLQVLVVSSTQVGGPVREIYLLVGNQHDLAQDDQDLCSYQSYKLRIVANFKLQERIFVAVIFAMRRDDVRFCGNSSRPPFKEPCSSRSLLHETLL